MPLTRAVTLVCAVLAASPSFAKGFPWCGAYARQHLVATDPGPAFNLACNWLKWGRPTTARVGAMVVWCGRHHRHVGKITGTDANGNFIIKSGNDGHAVRERVRSVAGASFRE